MTNIRNFRETPTVLNKAGAAVGYILLGWIVATYNYMAMGDLLSIFMIIGILVWAFVIRRRNLKYFTRYHITQALLLNISIAAALWLLVALFGLLQTLPVINIGSGFLVDKLFAPVNLFNLIHASMKDLFVMTVAGAMAVYAVRGEYAEMPWITEGVRHWL